MTRKTSRTKLPQQNKNRTNARQNGGIANESAKQFSLPLFFKWLHTQRHSVTTKSRHMFTHIATGWCAQFRSTTKEKDNRKHHKVAKETSGLKTKSARRQRRKKQRRLIKRSFHAATLFVLLSFCCRQSLWKRTRAPSPSLSLSLSLFSPSSFFFCIFSRLS